MAGYTPNCACTTVQANQANYITLNGKQVLKQYFSQDQGKMVYAYLDPNVSGGIIYKAQKPNENSFANNANSAQQRTHSKDAFSSQKNQTARSSNQGQYRSSQSNSNNSSQASQTHSLSFQKKPGTDDAYLTLPPGKSITVDQENGAGKLVIQNLTDRTDGGYAFRTQHEAAQSRKNIVIKQSPNRYGGYDYSVIDDTHKKNNGDKAEQRLYLPENNRSYNKEGNNVRTYKISTFGRASQYLSFPYDDSKQTLRDTKGQIKQRQTIADMQPNLDVDIDPGDSVNYLRPQGLDGSSSTVMIGDDKYEVSNKNESRFAYLIHRKQEDGSFKTFYATDSNIKDEKPLDKNALTYNFDLEFKFIEKISKNVRVSDEIKFQENPSKYEPQDVQDYKAAKNNLKEQSHDTTLLTQDQEDRINKLLQETTYKTSLPVKEKTAILQDLSNKINEIKTEDIALRKEKASERDASSENLLDELFGIPKPAVPTDDLDSLFNTDPSANNNLPAQETKEVDPLEDLFKPIEDKIELPVPKTGNEETKSTGGVLFKMFPEQQSNSLLPGTNFLEPQIDWGQELKKMNDDARLIFPVK